MDIVLLSMKLNRSSRMGQNPHFYNRTFPGAIKDLVARRNHRLEPLPFDCFLSEIQRSSERLVLYCLHDHESGNYIVLRYGQSLRSFTNLWEITLKSVFVLKGQYLYLNSCNISNSLIFCRRSWYYRTRRDVHRCLSCRIQTH